MANMTDITGILEYFRPVVPHDPGEVVLIGYTLQLDGNQASQAVLKFGLNAWEYARLNIRVTKYYEERKFTEECDCFPSEVQNPEIALIQAYVFEGNIYKLPKPKLMVLDERSKPVQSEEDDSKEECGTKNAESAVPASALRYWRINKLEKAIEISVETGFIEQLILESNLPGKRSPTSYAANFQMANRSVR